MDNFPWRLLFSLAIPLAALAAAVALVRANRLLSRQAKARRETETSLLENASLFREFVEDTDNCIVRVDAAGRLLFANPVAQQLFGCSSRACVGVFIYDYFPPADVPIVKAALREAIAVGGVKTEFEARVNGAEGQERHLTWSVNLHYDERGRIDHVNVIAKDHTHFTLYERSLEESERRYRTLFEATSEGVGVQEILSDETGRPVDFRVLDINPRYEELLGIPRSRAVGALGSELFTTEASLPRLSDVFARVAQTGEPAQVDTYNDARDRYFSLSVFSPKPGQFATIFHDITWRKQAEDAQRKALAFNRAILAHVPMGVAVYEAESGLCVLSNAAYAELTGAVCDQSAHGDFRRIPSWQETPGVLKAALQTLDTGRPHNLDVHSREGDDTRVLAYAFDRFDVSSLGHLLVLVVDITERIRMEEVCIQTEKLQSVGGLAAGLAHEINNPLGGVLQSVQVLRRRINSEMLANKAAAARAGCDMEAIAVYLEAREVPVLLQNIDDAGRRAAAIVATMLDFSRKSDSPHTPQDLHHLLEKALDICRNDFDLRQKCNFQEVSVHRDFDPDMPAVPVSAIQMEQVFVNLLRNAAQALGQFCPPEPQIVLRTRVEENQARIEIADNGPGMDEATRRRIFEPFFTTKQPGEGTGLGLSVSYYIVTANHGGQMSVDSVPDQGTTFRILVPLAAS